jgi:hypothetical protein
MAWPIPLLVAFCWFWFGCPTATPSPVPTATPSPAAQRHLAPPVPEAEPRVVREAPGAAPRILALHLDKQIVQGGDVVTGVIVTSSNVASVEARVATYSISVPKIGVGRFKLSYVVPYLPYFLHNTYAMRVIARNTAGDAVERDVSITVR